MRTYILVCQGYVRVLWHSCIISSSSSGIGIGSRNAECGKIIIIGKFIITVPVSVSTFSGGYPGVKRKYIYTCIHA